MDQARQVHKVGTDLAPTTAVPSKALYLSMQTFFSMSQTTISEPEAAQSQKRTGEKARPLMTSLALRVER